jgi:formylglycine-generating enzyme required for sulfatase activity
MSRRLCFVCTATILALFVTCDQNPTGPKENPVPPGMHYITGGTFQMGSTTGRSDELPVHTVTVSSFYIDTTDVTQADYLALMGTNPSAFTAGSDTKRPVEQVTWYDAVLYSNARSKSDHLDTVYSYLSAISTPETGCTDLDGLAIDLSKNGYHLPTEAQWEYACRADSTTDYFWGNDTTFATRGQYSWYSDNSDNVTHPVATKLPNAWGLYDMSGNVWQWCNDLYDNYPDGEQTDPTGPPPGTITMFGNYHIVRGGSFMGFYGSWYVGDLSCSASRFGGNPASWFTNRMNGVGFRCAR